jgi:hypothetical protein
LTGSAGELPLEAEESLSTAGSVASSGTTLARGDAGAGNREVASGSEEDGGTAGDGERDEQNPAAFQRRIMDLQNNAPQLGPDASEGRPAMERAPDTEPSPTQSPAPPPGEDRPAALDQFFRRWQVAQMDGPSGNGFVLANDTPAFSLREVVPPRAIPAMFRTTTPPRLGHDLSGSAMEGVRAAREVCHSPAVREMPHQSNAAGWEEHERLVTGRLSRFEGVRAPAGGQEARSSVAGLLMAALAVENLLLAPENPRRWSPGPRGSADDPRS